MKDYAAKLFLMWRRAPVFFLDLAGQRRRHPSWQLADPIKRRDPPRACDVARRRGAYRAILGKLDVNRHYRPGGPCDRRPRHRMAAKLQHATAFEQR
jgi:hypothetical protein